MYFKKTVDAVRIAVVQRVSARGDEAGDRTYLVDAALRWGGVCQGREHILQVLLHGHARRGAEGGAGPRGAARPGAGRDHQHLITATVGAMVGY